MAPAIPFLLRLLVVRLYLGAGKDLFIVLSNVKTSVLATDLPIEPPNNLGLPLFFLETQELVHLHPCQAGCSGAAPLRIRWTGLACSTERWGAIFLQPKTKPDPRTLTRMWADVRLGHPWRWR